MSAVDAIVAILLALAPGVASPGPNFLLVAHCAVRGSRCQALACAAGVSAGALVFAAAGVSGLTLVLRQWSVLENTLKVLGAAYIGWLGFAALRSAGGPPAAERPASATDGVRSAHSFPRGLFSQLGNVKGIAIYASVFAAFLPESLPGSAVAVLLAAVFALELGWYAAVALVLGHGRMREAYLRRKAIVDIGSGLAMLLISARLLVGAV